MSNHPFNYPNVTNTSGGRVATHEAITERARELWIQHGRPENCDLDIWLEAEAELLAIEQKRYRHPHLQLNQAASSRA